MNLIKTLLAIVLLVMNASLALTITASIADADQAKPKKEYTFAVIPQGPPESMHENWMPFIDRLSRDTGLPIRIKLYESMNDFEKDLKEGNVDFAFMNPIQQIMAWQACGYIPLLRSRKPIRGYVFVRKDSNIKGLQDMTGKEIALVSPQSVCSVIINHDLQAMKVSPRYLGSSINVFKNVEIGEAEVGGTLDFVFDEFDTKLNKSFHPIYTTEPISPHPISAHPSISPDLRRLVIEAVLQCSGDKDLQELLKLIGIEDAIAADYERDYAPLAQRLSKTEL